MLSRVEKMEISVPPDTVEIELIFRNPTSQHHLGFSLYDPLKRFRGWVSVKRRQKIVRVSSKDSRYFKGMYVPFGNWTLEITTRDRSDEFDYEFEVRFMREKRDWRWVMGEFHTHTVMSDGKWTVEELAQVLSKLGLEFFFVTDHNAYTLEGETHFKNIVAFPGIEFTTPKGHFIALGVRPGEVKLNAFSLAEISRFVFGPAHPYFPNDPSCKDCMMLYDLGEIEPDFLEIWNAVYHGEDPHEHNLTTVKIWRETNLPITAGGDVHDESFEEYWMPTWVLVPEITMDAVINSVVMGLTVVGHVSLEKTLVKFPDPVDIEVLPGGEKRKSDAFDLKEGGFIAFRNNRFFAAAPASVSKFVSEIFGE